MIFWGTTPAGESVLLGEPAEAALSYDKDAPADLLRAKFSVDRLWAELAQVSLYENGELAFRGVVDEQNAFLSASGLTVELVCRSLEALLLDSEAQPGTVLSPSLELLETRLLLPLGLTLGKGERGRQIGELTVEKGQSCWTVLEGFCRDRLGTVPFVDLEGRVQCGGVSPRRLKLRDVISAQVSLLPCKRLSRVWRQSCGGTYDTLYENPRPGGRGVRYVSMESGKNPRELIAAGEQDSFLLTVTCGGAWQPGRNGTADVELPGLGRFENCPVRSALWRRDKSGERTRFVLERGEPEEKREAVICG